MSRQHTYHRAVGKWTSSLGSDITLEWLAGLRGEVGEPRWMHPEQLQASHKEKQRKESLGSWLGVALG